MPPWTAPGRDGRHVRNCLLRSPNGEPAAPKGLPDSHRCRSQKPPPASARTAFAAGAERGAGHCQTGPQQSCKNRLKCQYSRVIPLPTGGITQYLARLRQLHVQDRVRELSQVWVAERMRPEFNVLCRHLTDLSPGQRSTQLRGRCIKTLHESRGLFVDHRRATCVRQSL